MIVTTSCGLCGPVEIRTDVDIIWAPVTDDEFDSALSLARTLHEIQAHLADIGPVTA